MGIYYYNCNICDKIFHDLEYYGNCALCENAMCGSCFDKQVKKYGEIGENHERSSWYGEEASNGCDACKKKKIKDIDIVEWFIKTTGLSREDVEDRIRKNIK